MSLEQTLVAIERQFWTGGPEAYEAHCDDACLAVFKEMAAKLPKADIAKQAEKGKWRDVSIKTKALMELSGDASILSYECTAKRKDGTPYHAVVSSGYVKRPDGWKLAFHQQTALD